MAQFVKTFYQELNNKKRTIRHCEDVCFTGDNLSDMIGVYLTVDGQPYTGGGMVSGTVINSRGQTIPITTGAISGNLVTVTLEQGALAVPGRIGIYVKLTTGTTVTTVLAAKFTVEQTETDTPIDPGTVISSVDALIARINTAVESIPADYSELLAGVAPSFSSSTAYTAGQYVWYPGLVDDVGALYRFTADHAAGSWTGTDAAAVVLADNVADLKSIFEDYCDGLLHITPFVANSYVDRAGTIKPYGGWARTDYIDVDGLYSLNAQTSVGSTYNCFYNANKEFVSYFGISTTETEILVPENAVYAIFSNTAQGMTDLSVTYITNKEKKNADALGNIEDQVDGLNTQISTLSDKVSHCLSFGGMIEKTFLNTDAAVGASPLAKTRRWFINHTFPTGATITKLDFSYGKGTTNQRIIYVEIWENVSGTLNKVKSVMVDVTAETTVPDTVFIGSASLDYTANNPCMVCLCFDGSVGAVLYTVDGTYQNRVLVSTDVSVSTNSLAFSSLTEFTNVNINPSIKIHYEIDSTTVVTIGDGMDYAEIQDALEAITDDTADNPYTFLIMPKKEPYGRFSTIRKLSDPYITSGRIRYISMIGVDKKNCVVRSDSGDYKAPCAEIMINGLLANLTFVMTNDNQTATAEKGGYCLHIDFEPTPAAPCNMVIENCDFEDSSGPCLGIGLRQNNTLTIRNCNIHTTLPANYAPHSGYRNLYTYGCLFAHTSSGATTQGQRIIIDNCFGLCEAGARSLNMIHAGSYDQSTADFKYTLMRNVFWNNSANAPAYNIDSDLTASPYNFGNNMT